MNDFLTLVRGFFYLIVVIVVLVVAFSIGFDKGLMVIGAIGIIAWMMGY